MKTKLYLFLLIAVSVLMMGCSDSDDEEDVTPSPEFKEGYVSRLKVYDLNNPGSEPKTIKMYYNSQRRVDGVHWGTNVPNRTAWKFVYAGDRINIEMTGDTAGIERYFTMDAQGRVSDMFYKSSGHTSQTSFVYETDRLVSLTNSLNGASEPSVMSRFTWNGSVISDVNTDVRNSGRDSLNISSSIIYDEFALNNSNIDLNIILDALNGIVPEYSEVPMLLKICGSTPSHLILRHMQKSVNAVSDEICSERSYQVLSYSMQQGRIAMIETENKTDGTHLKINIIYKSDN